MAKPPRPRPPSAGSTGECTATAPRRSALLRGMVRNDVAAWVVNLTAAASVDLLDCKDSVECDSDCRWIPSTTALAVDWHV